ncbi:MAG: 50S ribosomal protein L9 [Armatimonadetes bacterium]|nr:50S ribosomal protein L9 [Armatimonadota bacterium]
MMELFLLKDVDKLGARGDMVRVADGYGRNYLLPKGFAISTSKVNTEQIEKLKVKIEKEKEKQLEQANALADKIKSKSVSIVVPATDEGHLFGSVTEKEIADALKEESTEIDPECILLEKPIKEIGVYNIPVKLEQDVQTELKVWVVKE